MRARTARGVQGKTSLCRHRVRVGQGLMLVALPCKQTCKQRFKKTKSFFFMFPEIQNKLHCNQQNQSFGFNTVLCVGSGVINCSYGHSPEVGFEGSMSARIDWMVQCCWSAVSNAHAVLA